MTHFEPLTRASVRKRYDRLLKQTLSRKPRTFQDDKAAQRSDWVAISKHLEPYLKELA